jgi:hypothetical protein
MTSSCLACHGQFVGEPRPMLLPMPWDGPMPDKK